MNRNLIVAISLVGLLGCEPDSGRPNAGRVDLAFKELSDSAVTVVLSNGTSENVAVRGSRSFLGSMEVWLGDAELACETNKPTNADQQPFGLADGNPKVFEVEPGQSIKIVVPTTIPRNFKGGVCRVRLKLADRSTVGPAEFRP